MTLTQTLTNTFNYLTTDFWIKHGDPRMASYPLMSTFKTPLAIFLSYHLFVLYLGPLLMKHRKPFSLKSLIVPYNLILSVFNFYMFLRVIKETEYGRQLFDVEYKPTDDTSPGTMGQIDLSHTYLMSKYIDMLDTIFFVLRKKSNQVTALHVYHHSMVPTLGWIYLRLNAVTTTSRVFAFLNSPIHTIMYAYYGLAAIGPQMQPYLWWKRYITQIQIFQFVLLFVHGVYFCTFQSGYPVFFTVDIIFQSTFYLFMFTRFYLQTYQKKDSPRKKIE